MPSQIGMASFSLPDGARVEMVGKGTPLKWKKNDNGFSVEIPEKIKKSPPSKYVWVMKATLSVFYSRRLPRIELPSLRRFSPKGERALYQVFVLALTAAILFLYREWLPGTVPSPPKTIDFRLPEASISKSS